MSGWRRRIVVVAEATSARIRECGVLLVVGLLGPIAVPHAAAAAPAQAAPVPRITAVEVPAGYTIIGQPNARGQVLTRTPSGYVLWEPGRGETPVATPPVDVVPDRLTDDGDVIGHHSSGWTRAPYVHRDGTWTRVSPWWTPFASATQANDAGQVLGIEAVWWYFAEPVVWQDGWPTAAPTSVVEARDINNRGQVVVNDQPATDDQNVPAIWQAGGAVTALPLPARAAYARVSEINQRGDVLGSFFTEAAHSGIVLWRNGRATDLGTLGGDDTSSPLNQRELNEQGQVVGSSETVDGQRHAFLWEDGDMTDLGTLGGARSDASGINNRGQVVGSSLPATGAGTHAVLWQDGEMYDLQELLPGAISSRAQTIGDNGLIYGNASFPADDGGVQERTVFWLAPPP
jgi:probable HAF family extracellular repeat protein